MSAAPSAVEHRTKVAARIVTGSVGLTSYSCDSTRQPNAQTQGSAIAEHQPDGRTACRPSASRTPISRVRRAPRKTASICSVFKDGFDLLVQRAEIGDSQYRIGIPKDRPNRSYG